MAEGYPPASGVESGLLRRVAPNPSPMTQAGTNAYVLGFDDVCIIDPGPAIPSHLDALVAAVAGRPVVAILVTHSHLDHSPGAAPLGARLDAPVLAYGPSDSGRAATGTDPADAGGGEGVDAGFLPDATLPDGGTVAGRGWTLRAHWTPGHMGNHMAFEWTEARAVFTGDTVMGWASTMISPPDGDLGQFMASLDRLEALRARRFYPGHGDPVEDPVARCRALREHRRARGTAILAALDRPRTIASLVSRLYADTPPALHRAAGRNVLAHLVDLRRRGLASTEGGPDGLWRRP